MIKSLLYILLTCSALALTPPEVWKDYDPNAGDYKEEIIHENTVGGVYSRDTYISAYVNGEEIRVYCKYEVKEELRGKKHAAPALMDVHGWMGQPRPAKNYVSEGWAVMSHDYCGKSGERPHYTKYPETLKHGNMDKAEGGSVWSHHPDRSSITDYQETSDYVWYAIQRRVLSYLLTQTEADPTRVGARGYSYGGTLMWNMAMDERVKAVVAFFGVGFLEYYRTNNFWLYDPGKTPPEMSPGNKVYLATMAPQAHAPHIKAACLWLSGTNDHHGGHERSEHMFHKFQKDTPWNFALNARGHHSTDGIIQNDMMWLNKHVLGVQTDWPARPQSEIKLNDKGEPVYHLTPAQPENVTEVKAYYALKNPVSFARNWRDAEVKKEGDRWVSRMPVLNVEDYVFGFANITYKNTVVVTADFEAAIPSQLGEAVATDTPSDTISEGTGAWKEVGPAEGPGGVKGFRPIDNKRGCTNGQFSDPKYAGPDGASLSFQFYCTQPQKIHLYAGHHHKAELEITASNDWQEMTLKPEQFMFIHDAQQKMKNWKQADAMKIMPASEGDDLTKIVFAGFKWVK